MTANQVTLGAPGVGYTPDTIIITAYNRTGSGVVPGDVAMLDSTASDGATTTYAPGPSTSIYANAIAPTADAAADAQAAAASTYAKYGFWLDTVADDAAGRLQLRGIGKVMVQRSAGSGSVTPGLPLVVVSTEDLNATISSTLGVQQRVLGKFAQAATTISTRVLADVEFDGINYPVILVKATG